MAVIIPAHNEAALIVGTVHGLLARLDRSTRVIVVADNCDDKTADLARSAGADVTERKDEACRGKSFALAFARDYLMDDSPDAVFILDADCRVDRGSVEDMAAVAVSLQEPLQATNLLRAKADESALVLLSNFAMFIKNVVRARGLCRLGGGTTLFGTGMAFPWSVFVNLNLASSESVEDLSLALGLAQAGIKIHLYEDLLVTSDSADVGDSLSQRRRWEHGFLSHAGRYGLPLLAKGIAQRSRHLAILGMHLLVPPLALLFVMGVVVLSGAIAFAMLAGNPWPATCLFCALGAGIIATGVAWFVTGRSTLPFRALAQAPIYVLWKLPIYLGFVLARQTEWNRTRRANEKR